MGAIWLVAGREFRERIRRRGFLLAALGTPLLLIVLWVATALLAVDLPRSEAVPPSPGVSFRIGYVDPTGLIRRIPPPLSARRVRAYPDEAAGAEGLRRGEIDVLYVVSADYVETGAVRRVSRELPSFPPDDRALDWLLAGNLFPDATPEELERLLTPLGPSGPEMVVSAEGGETREAGGLAGDLRPFLAAVAIVLPLLTGGGYLFQSFAEEKDGRVLEILVLSAPPMRLLAGKLLGSGALTLVQYLAWGIILGPALVAGQAVAGPAGLGGLGVGWTVPFAAAGFLLYGVLAAGVGALAPSTESSRSWLFLISLPMMAPLYLWLVVVQRPDGPFAVAMSLFPLSAPAGMILRLASGPVPGWQAGLSLALLVATTAALVVATARLFRVHLLLGGERLDLRRVWRTLVAG